MSKQSDIVKVSQDAGTTGFVNTTGDTMTGQLGLTDNLSLYRTTSSVDGDVLGKVSFTNSYENPDYTASIEAVRGFYGNNIGLRFNVQQGGGGGSPVSITAISANSNGLVTMPYQPFAQASSSTVSTGKIPLNSFNVYRGGLSIDNTNQRFNVPVSGAYVIGYHHLGNSGSGACQVQIRVNGAGISGSRTQDTNSSNDSFGTQIIRVLAANDYIEFWVIQGATHGNNEYNSMWAYLIG